ncbi:TPA: N-acetyltransferase family protein [Vibrio parahaemolyticus]|uniref:GNAT family N-acetyltransferase n=1 Tax=Vibrio parahaemolyticus TaxID=670 RepID=UPI0004238680|nr:GNAT family N-acetyltransferase [Vibrio parahaemolyticus]EGQ7914876.1 GNAT family N-acetyltransferase [Vibrio parahaemolyticus]EHB9912034.1 GNAT family N-acetyltransferase [Vibrio parahaemolyticus]EJG2253953.1 GNAT family N-acetyltransferase [Vibrio parahaemolyticus]EKD4094114.1 GNAT family N-acetyltransferase [Vibrio parahaemolyticus]EKO1852753.1 GNAT family N-acetyltransferase [Vibrio parahaemolyticus]
MIKIRKYKESDARALWAIFYHTIRNVNIRDYSQAQVEAWAPDNFDPEVWQRKMNSIVPFVAEIDGDIVAYTDLQENGLIDHFFCHHEHQGKGIGRSLMEHVLSVGNQQGIYRFYSEVSITARPFYERLGFTLVQGQTVEVRGQTLNNFVMEKFS